ncbi:uncharacterized protein LOC106719798 [Papilio machaon]|uniref:uncharacterized protein LOC106719798 n=1 Tax=Papilio machaon TaxID=76193 RepID=UPI001E663E04|nr:uncharacterized protein LOC106719798 [Papilio machaon]
MAANMAVIKITNNETASQQAQQATVLILSMTFIICDMWPVRCIRFFFVFLIILLDTQRVCSAITNTNFNENIRKYSVKEDTNTTNVTTLMKQGKEQYSHFLPIPNPATFKTIADNELSSSSHSRGLLHHADYGVHDYEDSPHQIYEYHIQDTTGHHGFHHPGPIHGHGDHGNYHPDYYDHHPHGHHPHGHHHIGHHYKHHDHDLAAKTLLWPIAGIALLGAAAALVTNPVLLQLGVVSGRKKRDTEEITGPDVDVNEWAKKPQNTKNLEDQNNKQLHLSKLPMFTRIQTKNSKEKFENITPTKMTSTTAVNLSYKRQVKEPRYIPIPLKIPKI